MAIVFFGLYYGSNRVAISSSCLCAFSSLSAPHLADLHLATQMPYHSFKPPISVAEFASLYGHRGLAGTPPACLLSCTRYSFPSVRRGQPSIKSPIPIHTSSWGPTACSLPHSLSCCETLVASSGNLAVILPMRSCLFDNDFGRIRHIRHKSTFHDIRIGIHGTLKSPRRENTAGRAPAERSPVGIFFLHHFVPVGLASLRRASGLFIGCRRCLLFTLIFKQPIKVHVLVRHIVIR
ncbi:hypothetical protein V8B97DRAFT_982589 [Scleroderma yunnanense]